MEKSLRTSLIELKNNSNGNEPIFFDHTFYEELISYLDNEDPKVRKNSALLIGMYSFDDVVSVLLKGYHKEEKEFVKDAYLKGCLNHNCRPYIEEFEKIQKELMNNDHEEHAKHVQSQLKIVNQIILKNKKIHPKMIKMQHHYIDVILTTIPWYQYTLFEDIHKTIYKPVGQGVLVRSTSLMELKELRNYEEMLIPLSHCANMVIDDEIIVESINHSSLKDLLGFLYDSDEPFYFKVEDRLKKKNNVLINKVATGLSRSNPSFLLNSPHYYEILIVLKELRSDTVNAYLKLPDIENRRFTYRKEATAFSLKPFVAATLMKLAAPYLIDYARVLDPFCGSGTLLIERYKAKNVRFMIGIDTYKEAIDIAKKNASRAKAKINFINKDALRFVNNEDFDEIFTDMPTREQMSDHDSLTNLYDRFFKRIPRLVKHGGHVMIYTSELNLVRKNLRLHQNILSLLEHFELIRERRKYYFFIIKVR